MSAPDDATRLNWAMSLLSLDDTPEPRIVHRTKLLGEAIMMGVQGREAIDATMTAEEILEKAVS